MAQVAFTPDQFELAVYCSGRRLEGPEDPGITLNTQVASYLANQAFIARNDSRIYNDVWPEDTRVEVALGSTITAGPPRDSRGVVNMDHPRAIFGLNLTGGFATSSIHAAYLRSALLALDHDEMNRYRSSSAVPELRHPLRMLVIERMGARRQRKMGELASELLLTIPRPLTPLLERVK